MAQNKDKPLNTLNINGNISPETRAKTEHEFADSLPEMIFELDSKGNLIFINQKASQILGYSTEAFKGDFNFNKIVFPGDQEKVRTSINRLISGKKSISEEFRLLKKDGSIFHVVARAVPYVTKGKVVGIRGILTDINERKKMEDEIQEKLEMVDAITDNIGAGFCLISKDYRVLWVNKFVKNNVGDVAGKKCYSSLNTLDHICPDCGVRKVFEEGVERDTHEYRQIGVSGKPYFVELIATPIKDKEGHIKAAAEFVVDIAERKNAEEKLKNVMDQLVLSNEKLTVIGSLTRHDIRNKLMVIKNVIYILNKRIGENPESKNYLATIDSTIQMIETLLDFNSVYEKIGTQERFDINVAECFNQAVALHPNIEGIQIINECSELNVEADSLLRQILYNLIENSLKHGEKVTQIKLYFEEEKNSVKLYYEDDGIGISDSNKLKLFSAGFTTGNGSGLGLMLIKRIVDVYGWKIAEEGKTGKGVKFVITIPKLN